MSDIGQQERPRADSSLDVLGLTCPEPITRLQDHILDRDPGEVIEIVADDGGIQWDLPAWCISNGHTMLSLDDRVEDGRRVWRGYVRLETLEQE